jgi:agmatinase
MSNTKDWDNAFTGSELKGTADLSLAFGGALSFIRRKYTRDLTGVDVAVTGIPLDTATSNRPGARFGPAFPAHPGRVRIRSTCRDELEAA